MKSGKRQNKFCVIITMLLLVGMITSTMYGFRTDAEGPLQDAGVDTYLGTKTEAKVYADFENDIWLQFMQKNLAVGETVKVYPRRTPQIITNPTKNDVVRPVFTYKIIEGEDCISLDEIQSTDAVTVTATANGTAIVEVSYLAAEDADGNVWGACSDCNHGYFAIVVGEDSTLQPTIEFDKELDKYHTIYYSGEDTVPLSFSVDGWMNEEVETSVSCNGIPVAQDSSGQYIANLENRTNIIGVVVTKKDGSTASTYQMVDARKVRINLENQTIPEAKDEVSVGEKINISFEGITMPVYKLAGIYNPTYRNTRYGAIGSCVSYQCGVGEELTEIKGYCEQYDLSENNTISFVPKVAGKTNFSSGCIKTQWWGYDIGADEYIVGVGNPPKDADGNVAMYSGQYSYLPDFEMDVMPAKNIATSEVVTNTSEVMPTTSSGSSTQGRNDATTAKDNVTQATSVSTEEKTSDNKQTPASLKLGKVKAFKLKSAKKKIQLSWKLTDPNADGVEVQYSLQKNFSKKYSKKISKITTKRLKQSVAKYTLKKLKSKRRYYVRIRTYKKVNAGQRSYGKWISKSIKTK